MSQWKSSIEPEHILIIDDLSVGHEQLQFVLQGQYRVSWLSREDAGFAHILRDSPNLILLDVDPPGDDGRLFCRVLKADPRTLMIPVIFISSGAEPGDRFEGYQAGADDYVERPYNPEDLLLKIRIALDNRHDLEDARHCQAMLREELEESLAVSAELGEMARFFNEMHDCDNVRTLAERMLDTCERLGLRVIVRMLPGGHFFSHAGEVGSLDQEIMDHHKGREWFIDLGHRTLINAGSLCVLIRNMPVHDTMRHLRLKEVLKLLVGVVGRRLSALQQRPEQSHDQASLLSLVAGIQQLIDHLKNADNGVRHQHAPHHLNRLFLAWEADQA
ncbi:MAG: response regulator [Candidatus Thiodiazotropha sp.]